MACITITTVYRNLEEWIYDRIADLYKFNIYHENYRGISSRTLTVETAVMKIASFPPSELME